MSAYLLKWAISSLIMPLLVLLFGRLLNEIVVLIFWPGAIALLSLGAEEKHFTEVFFTWFFAICINVVTYLVVGFVIYHLMKSIKG